MRSWMLISLLLLSVLIHEAQGIRFIKNGTPPDGQHISHKTLQGRSNDSAEEVFMCKGNHCSGRFRKLMVNLNSSASTIAKKQNDKSKEKIATKEENLSVNSSSTTGQREPAAPETYPGVLDIAGMDYSQARRKPPIHN